MMTDLNDYMGGAAAMAPLGEETPAMAILGEKRRQRMATAFQFVGGFALAMGLKTALVLTLASTPPLLMAVITLSSGSALSGLWEARKLAKQKKISFREAMKSSAANKTALISFLGGATFLGVDHFLHIGQHLADFVKDLGKSGLKSPSFSFAEITSADPGVISSAQAASPVSSPVSRISLGLNDTGILPIPEPARPMFSMQPVPSAGEAFAPVSSYANVVAPQSSPLMSTPYNSAALPTDRVSMTFPAPASEVTAAVAAPSSVSIVGSASVSAPVSAPVEAATPPAVEAVSAPVVEALPELPVAEPAKPVLDCVVREQLNSNTPEWPSYMTAGRAPEPTTLQPVCKAFKDVVQPGDILRGTVEATNAEGVLTSYTYESTAIRPQSMTDLVPKWVQSIVARTYGFGSMVR